MKKATSLKLVKFREKVKPSRTSSEKFFGCGGGTCNHRIARKCVQGRLFGAARSHPTRRGGSEVVRRLDFVSKKGTASMRMLFLFCIAPPKKISPKNPYGIRDFGVF